MESLIDNFHQVSKKYPNSIAIKEAGRSISYDALRKLVISFSKWLSAQGFEKGDRVGIHFSNSIEYVCAYYACWQMNLVPVAFNTYASPQEISKWVENCGCKLIVSNKLNTTSLASPVYTFTSELSNLFINKAKFNDASLGFRAHDVNENDIATIIYTSGTTGNPKGITLTHKNLTSNTNSIIKSLSIVKDDNFLCVLPFFYSFGNSILHTHLAAGATLVLQNSVIYPNDILKLIEKSQCTGFAGVPSIYIALIKKTNFSNYNLSSLRYMTQAGGSLSREFIEQVRQRLPGIDFVVMYGQTEASARISYLQPDLLDTKIGSVGVGIDGVDITVENKHGNECKANEKGEICVKGESLMLGYWKNPSATARVLTKGKLLTGDMGYKDKDGFLFIVGRQTEILKISDHRVSPYEIEETLLLHPEVEECAVIGCSHDKAGQFAKAYVVKSSSDVSGNNLKRFCKQYLANYKVPKEIEFIETLPKTSSGKIKRSQLSC